MILKFLLKIICLQDGQELMQRMNAKESLLDEDQPVLPCPPKDLVLAVAIYT